MAALPLVSGPGRRRRRWVTGARKIHSVPGCEHRGVAVVSAAMRPTTRGYNLSDVPNRWAPSRRIISVVRQAPTANCQCKREGSAGDDLLLINACARSVGRLQHVNNKLVWLPRKAVIWEDRGVRGQRYRCVVAMQSCLLPKPLAYVVFYEVTC